MATYSFTIRWWIQDAEGEGYTRLTPSGEGALEFEKGIYAEPDALVKYEETPARDFPSKKGYVKTGNSASVPLYINDQNLPLTASEVMAYKKASNADGLKLHDSTKGAPLYLNKIGEDYPLSSELLYPVVTWTADYTATIDLYYDRDTNPVQFRSLTTKVADDGRKVLDTNSKLLVEEAVRYEAPIPFPDASRYAPMGTRVAIPKNAASEPPNAKYWTSTDDFFRFTPAQAGTVTSPMTFYSIFVPDDDQKLVKFGTLKGMFSAFKSRLADAFAAKEHTHELSLAESDIPSLPASKIGSGTFDAARIPGLGAGKISSGTLDAARIPGLDAAKLASGVLPVERGGTGVSTLEALKALAGAAAGALTYVACQIDSLDVDGYAHYYADASRHFSGGGASVELNAERTGFALSPGTWLVLVAMCPATGEAYESGMRVKKVTTPSDDLTQVLVDKEGDSIYPIASYTLAVRLGD